MEKIGASKYVWAFVSEQATERNKKLKKLEAELEKIDNQIAKSKETLEKAKNERVDPQRSKILEKLPVIRESNEEKRKKIESFDGCDPLTLKKYTEAVQVAQNAAERWTDNIYAVIKIVKDKKCMKESEILAAFGLPADFDYID